jgi:hypothetical protein
MESENDSFDTVLDEPHVEVDQDSEAFCR